MRLKASSGGAIACSAHCNSMMRRVLTTSGGWCNNCRISVCCDGLTTQASTQHSRPY